MLCFSQLGLCLVVLYSGNRTKEAGHREEKGGSKNYPTLQPFNGSQARDGERDNHSESTFIQLRNEDP